MTLRLCKALVTGMVLAPVALAVSSAGYGQDNSDQLQGIDADAICAPFLNAPTQASNRSRLQFAGRTGAAMPPSPAPVAPPPPPALAPASPPSNGSNKSIVVTGSRISRQNQNSAAPLTIFGSSDAVQDREQYDGEPVSSIMRVADMPVSTFAVDVDTGSYANSRRQVNAGAMPRSEAVRTEEMLNYFRYDYPKPDGLDQPFSVSTDLAITPWNSKTRLLRIGLAGYDLPEQERPTANLVFLVDVSGSMNSRNKLPLVKCSLALAAEQLRPQDRISIVTYSGKTSLALEPTNEKRKVLATLTSLRAGGSTAGGAAMQMAYDTARANFKAGQVNRILMATDGDFNVGVTSNSALIEMVERERKSGILITTLGFGTGNYNEAMMEQIANKGNGNYFYIDQPKEAQKVLSEEVASTLFTIAKDVKIQVEFNPAHVSEYRLIGYENRELAEEDFNNDAVDAGEIGAGHQVTALYEIVPNGTQGWTPKRRFEANALRTTEPNGSPEMAEVRLRYKRPDGTTSKLIKAPIMARDMINAKQAGGDFAFVAAIAGFGQYLRQDKYLNGWSPADSLNLARPAAGGPWRSDFIEMVTKAQKLEAGQQVKANKSGK